MARVFWKLVVNVILYPKGCHCSMEPVFWSSTALLTWRSNLHGPLYDLTPVCTGCHRNAGGHLKWYLFNRSNGCLVVFAEDLRSREVCFRISSCLSSDVRENQGIWQTFVTVRFLRATEHVEPMVARVSAWSITRGVWPEPSHNGTLHRQLLKTNHGSSVSEVG